MTHKPDSHVGPRVWSRAAWVTGALLALALALTVAGQWLAPPGAAGVLVKGLLALAFAAAALALGLHRDRGAVARGGGD